MHPSHLSSPAKTRPLKQDTSLSESWAIAELQQTRQQVETALCSSDGRTPLTAKSSRLSSLPALTASVPLPTCRVSVVIPVRNEEHNLPAVIKALSHQIDRVGDRIDRNLYEILVLANNCTDRTVGVLRALGDRYSSLQLHVIDVVLPPELAFVGKARQMAMDEAYRRFALVGASGRIIASTDGDTTVSANWIASLLEEFDRGIDAVGGRIMTCRMDSHQKMNSDVSLCYLRRVAHAYLSSQIACLLDPQVHDSWPRHFQFCGANMAVSAEMYGEVDGIPLVRDEEDVALYRRLQKADAKIRHSLAVQVQTSARQVGRATGGLSELLTALSTGERKDALVEDPVITEARIVMRRYLRRIWVALQQESWASRRSFGVGNYARTAGLLARALGVPVDALRSHIEEAATFGELMAALSVQQLEHLESSLFEATTEISLANTYLRQRLNRIRKRAAEPVEKLVAASEQIRIDDESQSILKALQQVQAIPLFPPAYK